MGMSLKIIILAAGQGRRLLPLTETAPKALLDIHGRSLLAVQVEAFKACGATEIVVLTGFRSQSISKELVTLGEEFPAIQFREVYNPFFNVADNLASCWMARHEMSGDFILVNGDNLFRHDVVCKLLSSPDAPITLAIDRKASYDEDDMKVMLDGTRLTEIGKRLPLDTVDAESIGMILFRGEGPKLFRAALEKIMLEPDALRRWYLSVIGALARQVEVQTSSIEGLEWCEVDVPLDLQHARGLVASWGEGRSSQKNESSEDTIRLVSKSDSS